MSDFLAAREQGATNRPFGISGTHLLLPDHPLLNFGALSVTALLPLKDLHSTAWGYLWTCLYPASLAPEQWAGDYRTAAFVTGRFMIRFPDELSKPPNAPYSLLIKALDPGEYRIKFVWRAVGENSYLLQTNFYLPQAPDFVSVESAPFLIEAGKMTEIPPMPCTNRVEQRWTTEE